MCAHWFKQIQFTKIAEWDPCLFSSSFRQLFIPLVLPIFPSSFHCALVLFSIYILVDSISDLCRHGSLRVIHTPSAEISQQPKQNRAGNKPCRQDMEPCRSLLSLLPRDPSKTADKTSHIPWTSLMENKGSTSKIYIYWDKALWWFEVICAESFWTRGVFKWENQMIGPNFTCSLTRINHFWWKSESGHEYIKERAEIKSLYDHKNCAFHSL